MKRIGLSYKKTISGGVVTLFLKNKPDVNVFYSIFGTVRKEVILFGLKKSIDRLSSCIAWERNLSK